MTRSHEPVLRSLDPASAQLDGAQRRRADDVLERILATPVERPARPRPRARRRLLLAPAVAAAVAVAAVLALHDRGGSDAAYASWTPSPAAVSPTDLDAVVASCHAEAKGYAIVGDARLPVALAERRGDFVAVLLRRDDPDLSVSCIARNVAGSDRVDDVRTGASGSSGPAWTPPAGQITEGAISQFGDPQPAAFADGAVGAGVVGVTIHAGAYTVEATVANGRYAAWWPGAAFEPGPPPPSGEGGPEPILRYDVELADGTVLRDVTPALPR